MAHTPTPAPPSMARQWRQAPSLSGVQIFSETPLRCWNSGLPNCPTQVQKLPAEASSAYLVCVCIACPCREFVPSFPTEKTCLHGAQKKSTKRLKTQASMNNGPHGRAMLSTARWFTKHVMGTCFACTPAAIESTL